MKKHRPTIYLAGGMEKAGESGRLWREEITPFLIKLGYSVWNPYEKEINIGVSVERLQEYKQTNYELFLHYTKKIVDYDISCLLECQAVAVKIDNSVLQGAGTFGELTFCRVHRIPVYAWIDLPNKQLGVPGWAMGCVSEFSDNKKDFYSLLPPAEDLKKAEWSKYLQEYVDFWREKFIDR